MRLAPGPVWDSVRPVVRSFGACVFVFYYEKGISSGFSRKHVCQKSKMSICIEFFVDCLIETCCYYLCCSKELDFIEPEYNIDYESLPEFDVDYIPMVGNPLYKDMSGSGHQFKYTNMAP